VGWGTSGTLIVSIRHHPGFVCPRSGRRNPWAGFPTVGQAPREDHDPLDVNTLETTPPAPVVEAFTRPNVANRFGPRWFNFLRAWCGTPGRRRLGHAALQIPRTRFWEAEFSRLSDEEVRKRGMQFRGRARGGESLDRMLPEVFGLVCVAALRTLGLRPFDVQLAAGVVLHRGALAEVATGEGKTLIATLPATLNALVGKGVHVTTVNDYLARRDAEWTSPIYNALGLTVGCLYQKMQDAERTAAYRCDITYGTASEFGFDFLRDRLKVSGDKGQALPFWAAWTGGNGQYNRPLDPKVQREHHYALVDEADNIFIDEAKTPLIIAQATRLATEEEQVVYHWADKLAKQMTRDQHFYLDEKKHHKVELTEEGKTLVRYSNPPVGEHSHAMDKLHEHVERAIHANHRYRLDQHYLIEEDKIVIIDEYTGRRMPDRHWREGLHQAVEAKEGVPVTKASDHAAQITFQRYFRLYKKLAGMTGTAGNTWEMRRVYKIWVVRVPTNRPVIRQYQADRVFPNEKIKFDAVIEEVVRLHNLGRPVLIGTRSVDKSENLSSRLRAAGIDHQVLNAKPENIDREAEIVAQAGRQGTVTIATNMAGRGTDIILGGNPEYLAWARLKDRYPTRLDVPEAEWKRTVAEIETNEHMKEEGRRVSQLGGLHVLGTERHEAKRIDRQLQGRAARQGDPGSCQFFLALDDELLEGLGQGRQEALHQRGQAGGGGSWTRYLPEFLRAQRRVERKHYLQRVDLMIYEKQRQEILKDLGADPYVD
jgi:preprotein translocase subunit SecA